MKKCIYQLFLAIMLLLVSACSDDFLRDNLENKTLLKETVVYLEPLENTTVLNINLNGHVKKSNAAYKIRQYPLDIKIKQLSGNLSNFSLNIDCSHTYYSSEFNQNIGEIVIEIIDEGYVLLTIKVGDDNNPENENWILRTNPSILDFGTDQISNYFYIETRNDVSYKVTSYPSWIKVPEKYLYYNNSSYTSIQIGCDRQNMEGGKHSGFITIQCDNDMLTTINVAVRMEVKSLINPSNLKPVEGFVADAVFDKQRDKLYYITQFPNRLISIDAVNEETSSIELDKTPNCIALSEDGEKIFIGQNHMITIVDAPALTVNKFFDINVDVFDLVYGENNWCYMTIPANGVDVWGEGSRYINIESGEFIVPKSSYSGRERIEKNTQIEKIKNKNLIIAARTQTSPSGIYSFGIDNDTLVYNKYWHEDLGSNYFTYEDGSAVISESGSVLEPASIGSEFMDILGQLKKSGSGWYYRFKWLDHCPTTKSIWGSYGNSYFSSDENIVAEFDAVNFNQKRSITHTTKYATTVNGIMDYYPADAYYVFSNKNGTRLIMLKNVTIDYPDKSDIWFVETVEIN